MSAPLLFDAIEMDDVELVRALIAAGEDIHERVEGMTYLLLAVHNNNLEITKLLLESGADPNAHDDNEDYTAPLFWAVYSDRRPFIAALLEHGARFSLAARDDSVLHAAIEKGHTDLLRWLLDNGARDVLEVFDYVGRTPLCCAIDKNNLLHAEMLLQAGADVNAVGGDDHPTCRTPLQRAVDDGHVEMARLLLLHHADPRLTACGMVAPPLELARRWKKRPELAELIEQALGGKPARQKRAKRRSS